MTEVAQLKPSDPGAPVLAVDRLTVSYRRRGIVGRVVRDLSFEVAPGEAYGLVGESGCGKSTVAMTLMRYLPANATIESGEIRFCGEDLLRANASTLQSWRGARIAMVYQDPSSSLNPTMRVGDQIAEVYRYHKGLPETHAAEAARDMLSRVLITDPELVSRRFPHELSGGQQQRVVIAMALAANPQLLVLDEPTTGLDATVEAEVLDLVEELRQQFEAAIIFISHNLAIVSRICDRVGVLYGGRLVEEGLARDVFRSPRHPYTLGLLRCVPRLDANKSGNRLRGIPGRPPSPWEVERGCIYLPRCPLASPVCEVGFPAPVAFANAHTAHCNFADAVPELEKPASASPSSVGHAGRSPLLKVEELVKTYGKGRRSVTAVAGITFELRTGEVLGLVGESGSGKSTVAKCIAGLTDATSGTIIFGDVQLSRRAYRRDKTLRRSVQMVFQNPDTELNPKHTVRRILLRSIKLLREGKSSSERNEVLRSLVRAVQLEGIDLSARPPRLSGGQRQRVAIGRALASAPRLILCDEPASALDVSVQAGILNLLADVQVSSGASYIFISHDLAAVRYLADQVAVMYLGQLVDIGSARAVFEAPQHPYTETLLSALTDDVFASKDLRRLKLAGSPPSVANPPSGCRFHTRCPRYLGSICSDVEPPWQETSDKKYRCHIPAAELRAAQRGSRDRATTSQAEGNAATQ